MKAIIKKFYSSIYCMTLLLIFFKQLDGAFLNLKDFKDFTTIIFVNFDSHFKVPVTLQSQTHQIRHQIMIMKLWWKQDALQCSEKLLNFELCMSHNFHLQYARYLFVHLGRFISVKPKRFWGHADYMIKLNHWLPKND